MFLVVLLSRLFLKLLLKYWMSVLSTRHDTDISVLRVVYSFHFPPSLDANKSHGELSWQDGW